MRSDVAAVLIAVLFFTVFAIIGDARMGNQEDRFDEYVAAHDHTITAIEDRDARDWVNALEPRVQRLEEHHEEFEEQVRGWLERISQFVLEQHGG